MDYVQEELLRQEKALTVLMGGGTREQEDADRTEPAELVKCDLVEQVLAKPAREHGWVEDILKHTKHASLRERMRDDVARVAVSEYGNTVRSGVGMKWNDRADVARIPGYLVPRERSEPEERTDVRTVSRSIQRDARRYDGGFSIY